MRLGAKETCTSGGSGSENGRGKSEIGREKPRTWCIRRSLQCAHCSSGKMQRRTVHSAWVTTRFGSPFHKLSSACTWAAFTVVCRDTSAFGTLCRFTHPWSRHERAIARRPPLDEALLNALRKPSRLQTMRNRRCSMWRIPQRRPVCHTGYGVV